jgi:hypothetical protein
LKWWSISGRQRTLKLAVKAEWWQVLKGRYERTWLATTTQQLESQGDGFGLQTTPVPGAATLVPSRFLRQIARQTTDDPVVCPAHSVRLNSNSGF